MSVSKVSLELLEGFLQVSESNHWMYNLQLIDCNTKMSIIRQFYRYVHVSVSEVDKCVQHFTKSVRLTLWLFRPGLVFFYWSVELSPHCGVILFWCVNNHINMYLTKSL